MCIGITSLTVWILMCSHGMQQTQHHFMLVSRQHPTDAENVVCNAQDWALPEWIRFKMIPWTFEVGLGYLHGYFVLRRHRTGFKMGPFLHAKLVVLQEEKSVRKSGRKVTERVPKTKKSDRTSFCRPLLRHPESPRNAKIPPNIQKCETPRNTPSNTPWNTKKTTKVVFLGYLFGIFGVFFRCPALGEFVCRAGLWAYFGAFLLCSWVVGCQRYGLQWYHSFQNTYMEEFILF